LLNETFVSIVGSFLTFTFH